MTGRPEETPAATDECAPGDHVIAGGMRYCHCTCRDCWDRWKCVCPSCQCEEHHSVKGGDVVG